MRFQFSILTMLVCTAALAVVSCWAVKTDVLATMHFISSPANIYEGHWEPICRQPRGDEIAWRLAWAGPLAVFASLYLLRLSQRVVKRVKRSGPITEITQHPLS